MHVAMVHVHVKTEHLAAFVEATRRNHEASVREPGNRRFDVLRSAENPAWFVLYEAYATKADAAAHKETAHYRAWRDAVAPWMAEPRKAFVFEGLHPA